MCTSSSCANTCRRRVLCYYSDNAPPSSHQIVSPFNPTILSRINHQLLRPKMLVIVALLFCWNLRSSLATAVHLNSESPFNPTFPHMHHHFSTRPYFPFNHHHHQRSLRSSSSSNQIGQLAGDDTIPLGGAGITLSDETALIINPVTLRSLPMPPFSSSSLLIPEQQKRRSSQVNVAGELELSEPKRKRICGAPSVATRALAGPSLKRSFFAFTQDEVDEKMKNDEYRQASERRKRDVQHKQLASFQAKRTGGPVLGTGADSPLPWTCETKYEWKDMGVNHYPRFVRTAECKTRLCFNGFFRCRPRRYKTKVLKRVTPSDSTSCEEDDVSLPETLRQSWKFVTVTINLCCDCTGRSPGPTNTEV